MRFFREFSARRCGNYNRILSQSIRKELKQHLDSIRNQIKQLEIKITENEQCKGSKTPHDAESDNKFLVEKLTERCERSYKNNEKLHILYKCYKDKLFEPFIKIPYQSVAFPTSIFLIIASLYFLIKNNENNDAETLVDPIDNIQTGMATRLYEYLRRHSKYDVVDSDNVNIDTLHRDGIFGLNLFGLSGSGKSQILRDIIKIHYLHDDISLPVIDCSQEAFFIFQIIKLVRTYCDTQAISYHEALNYERAIDLLSQYLESRTSRHGWLFVFDDVDADNCDFLKKFLIKLCPEKQCGNILIASNKAVDFKYSNISIISEEIGKGLFRLSDKKALQLLEKTTKSMYEKEPLGYLQKIFKNTEITENISPGYPHTDLKLKQTLIKLLNNSPQLIYAAGRYLNTVHGNTGRPTNVLLSEYIENIKQGIGYHYSQLLIEQPAYLDDKDINNIFEKVVRAVHNITLENLYQSTMSNSNLSSPSTDEIAFELLPVCVFLDRNQLYSKYLQAYIQYRYQGQVVPSENDIKHAIFILYDYGILKRHYPHSSGSNPDSYTRFYVDSSLKESYEIFLKNNKTDKHALRKEIAIVGDFIKTTFELNNKYLKSVGKDWHYVGNCLSYLKIYRTQSQHAEVDKIVSLVELLKIYNPMMNMLMQMGSVTELELFYFEMQKLIDDIEVFPKSPKSFNEVSINSLEDLNKNLSSNEVDEFCKKLYMLHKELPIYYTQLQYYRARRALKTPLPQQEFDQAFNNILLCCNMRKVIEKFDYPVDSKMAAFEVEKFLRDGLSPMLIKAGKNRIAIQLLTSIKEDGKKAGNVLDPINAIHCNMHIADAYIKDTSPDFSKAESHLSDNLSIIISLPEDKRRIAKSSRNYLLRARINILQGNSEKALKLLKKCILGASYEQFNDRAEALYLFGEIYTKKFFLQPDAVDDEELTSAIDALEDSLMIKDNILVYPDNEYTLSCYYLSWLYLNYALHSVREYDPVNATFCKEKAKKYVERFQEKITDDIDYSNKYIELTNLMGNFDPYKGLNTNPFLDVDIEVRGVSQKI